MAAPNIVNVSNISGNTAVQVVSTSATAIVSNAAASNTVVKINNLIIANTSASVATITASVYRSSTDYYLTYQISVPANASFTAIDKPTSIYLQEGDSLRLLSGTASALHAICSYEIIS